MVSTCKESLGSLRQDGERYKLLTATVNDLIWTMNTAGEFTYISPSVERQVGYTQGEMVNRTLEHVLTPTSIDIIHKILIDLATKLHTDKGVETGHIELEGFHKDGSIVWFDVSYGAKYTPSGEFIVLGIARDITERKQAALERDHLISELQQALADVKTLRGLFPICASCKKIRDDKGYWNQIESYISERSDAVFSHGICPECAKKLYPDFYHPKK